MATNDPTQPENNEPDTARVYERAKPEKEAGMGRLNNVKATPADRNDPMENAVPNRQGPRQVNAQDVQSARTKPSPAGPGTGPAADQPDHSMLDEEPDGWDQAPSDIHSTRDKRHPRTEGKGGTP